MTIRILIADDHRVIREGLRYMLCRDPEFEIIGEAINGINAVRLARELRPDVILMDLSMPKLDGLQATDIIRSEMPNIKVILLSVESDIQKINTLLKAGVSGYLTKESTGEGILCEAIRAVSLGQIYLSSDVRTEPLSPTATPTLEPSLTPREMDVLDLLVQAQSDKEIAHSLGIDVKTVHTHVSNILHKLRVPSRSHAALYALRRPGLGSRPHL